MMNLLRLFTSCTSQQGLHALTFPAGRFASPKAVKSFPFMRRTDLVKFKQDTVCFGTFEGTPHQPYHLTRDEAFSFVENVLGIEHPHMLITEDPVQNLSKLASQMKKNVPYTTMHFFDKELSEFSDEFGKREMLSGHGGGCCVINPFMKALLEQIGYKTIDVASSTPGCTDCYHISTLVCDLTYPGSYHLVDPGTAIPLLDPIPLDFEKESPIYETHGIRYKFFKTNNDSHLTWCIESSPEKEGNLKDNQIIYDLSGKKWTIFVFFLLKKKMARYHYNKYWQTLVNGEAFVAENTQGLIFNTFRDGKMIHVNGTKDKISVKLIDEDSTKKNLEMTREELLAFFENRFPFAKQMVEKAIMANFQWVPQKFKEAGNINNN